MIFIVYRLGGLSAKIGKDFESTKRIAYKIINIRYRRGRVRSVLKTPLRGHVR